MKFTKRATNLIKSFLAFIGLSLCLVFFVTCGADKLNRIDAELIIGARADDYIIEPLKSRLGMYPLNTQICESLVRITAGYEIEPLLGTHWERRGNTWRFFLRPGVVFSDGQLLTSDAVKYTFERMVKGDAPSVFQHTYIGEESVDVVDDLTVDITPVRENMRLLEQIGHSSYSIIAPGTEPAVEPICTGPFKLAEYHRSESIKLERNENYWGRLPALKRLTFRFLPDDATRVLALEAGEVGMILDVPREQAAQLREQANIRIVEAPVGRVATILLNIHGQAPYDLLASKDVRHALAMAIDRRALIEKVWDGNGEPIATIGPVAMLGDYASLVQGVPHEPQQAAQLLARAGWITGRDGVRVQKGRRLSLTLIAWTEFDKATLEFLQAQLAAIGVEIQIVRSPDTPSYQARVDAGEFDLDLEGGSQNDANPIFLPALRFYSKSSGKTIRYFALGSQFDEIIEAGLSANERGEVMRRSAEAQHQLVDVETSAIPLAGLKRIYAMSDTVRDFDPHPSLLNQRWDVLSIQR